MYKLNYYIHTQIKKNITTEALRRRVISCQRRALIRGLGLGVPGRGGLEYRGGVRYGGVPRAYREAHITKIVL